MTTPYTTGTITLTNGSAVVTGVGTAWQTALIAGGTIFVDASGNSLPILSVDTNTQITAAVKWRGATGTYSYAIVRDTAYGEQTVANAQALSTYLQRLDNASLSAIASLVPAADRLPYFTGAGAGALAIFTAFARQLIGALNGAAAYTVLGEIPTNQLPQRLWTGAQTITDWDTAIDSGFYNSANGSANGPNSAFLCGVVFTRGNTHATQIVADFTNRRVYIRTRSSGTFNAWRRLWTGYDVLEGVSQDAGVPTGGLMDYGSNANGTYMRFANGLMVCTSPVFDLAPDTAAGSLWVSTDTPWNLPGTMVSAGFSAFYNANTGQRWTSARPTNATQVYVRQWSFSASSTVIGGRAVAIGRWF